MRRADLSPRVSRTCSRREHSRRQFAKFRYRSITAKKIPQHINWYSIRKCQSAIIIAFDENENYISVTDGAFRLCSWADPGTARGPVSAPLKGERARWRSRGPDGAAASSIKGMARQLCTVTLAASAHRFARCRDAPAANRTICHEATGSVL